MVYFSCSKKQHALSNKLKNGITVKEKKLLAEGKRKLMYDFFLKVYIRGIN